MVGWHIQNTHWGVFPVYRDAVGIFYSLSQMSWMLPKSIYNGLVSLHAIFLRWKREDSNIWLHFGSLIVTFIILNIQSPLSFSSTFYRSLVLLVLYIYMYFIYPVYLKLAQTYYFIIYSYAQLYFNVHIFSLALFLLNILFLLRSYPTINHVWSTKCNSFFFLSIFYFVSIRFLSPKACSLTQYKNAAAEFAGTRVAKFSGQVRLDFSEQVVHIIFSFRGFAIFPPFTFMYLVPAANFARKYKHKFIPIYIYIYIYIYI